MTLDMQCHKGKPLHSLGFLSCQWDAFDVCYNICCKRDGRVLGAWVWSYCRLDWRRKQCCQKYWKGKKISKGTNLRLQWPPCTYYLLLLLRKWKYHCGAACANAKDCWQNWSFWPNWRIPSLPYPWWPWSQNRPTVPVIHQDSCNKMERLHWGRAIWHIILVKNKMGRLKWLSQNARETYSPTSKERRHAVFAVEKEDMTLLTWCWKHGMNPLPRSLQTKKLLLNEVGVHWTTTLAPSVNSTDKYNLKSANRRAKETIINPPLPNPHPD